MLERYRLLPAFEEKYQVGDELGSGGFGFVVTATRRSDGAEVAVKFIFKEKVVVQALTNDPDFGVVPMEVHVIKKLHHPNIIGFLDFFTDNRFYYLVMELHGVPWQKGVDLNTLRLKSASQPPALHRSYSEPSPRVPVIGRRHSMDLFECIEANSRLSENVAQKIFSQVASAVEHLLDHNIVHRDIKDENLVVDAHFNVKLIDFGSALHIPTNGRLFERFAGTLQYCPPEVIQGNKYRGPEQEVWALGILLYTILFSGAPFANVNQVLNNDLPIPKHSRGPMAGKPRASEEVVHLLRWMLRKNPSERAGIKDIMAHPWLS
ncbi:kinase-like domain-containing protein, partial [Blastocladiella britannica]